MTGAAGEIENSTTFGGWAELIYSVGDVNIGGGAAWMRVENDTWENGDISQFKYYAYVSYALHENLTLQPEIGFTDFGDDTSGNDAGNSFLQFGFLTADRYVLMPASYGSKTTLIASSMRLRIISTPFSNSLK